MLHYRAGCRGLRTASLDHLSPIDSVFFAFRQHPQVFSCYLATFARKFSKGLGPSPLGFFFSSVPMWAAFPHPLTRVRIPAASDYYAPYDSFKGHWNFVWVAPSVLSTLVR